MTDKTYTREEVQRWRDDIAHAAADMVQRASPAFGDGDWSWLVNAIRGMAKNQPRPTIKTWQERRDDDIKAMGEALPHRAPYMLQEIADLRDALNKYLAETSKV